MAKYIKLGMVTMDRVVTIASHMSGKLMGQTDPDDVFRVCMDGLNELMNTAGVVVLGGQEEQGT